MTATGLYSAIELNFGSPLRMPTLAQGQRLVMETLPPHSNSVSILPVTMPTHPTQPLLESAEGEDRTESSLIGTTIEFVHKDRNAHRARQAQDKEGTVDFKHDALDCSCSDKHDRGQAEHASDVSSLSYTVEFSAADSNSNSPSSCKDDWDEDDEAHNAFRVLRDSSHHNHSMRAVATPVKRSRASCDKPRSIFGSYWDGQTQTTASNSVPPATGSSAGSRTEDTQCKGRDYGNGLGGCKAGGEAATASPRSVVDRAHSFHAPDTSGRLLTTKSSEAVPNLPVTAVVLPTMGSDDGTCNSDDEQQSRQCYQSYEHSLSHAEAVTATREATAHYDPYHEGDTADDYRHEHFWSVDQAGVCMWHPFASKPSLSRRQTVEPSWPTGSQARATFVSESDVAHNPTWWNWYWDQYRQQTKSRFALQPSVPMSSRWWKTASDPSFHRSGIAAGSHAGAADQDDADKTRRYDHPMLPRSAHGRTKPRFLSDTQLSTPSVPLRSCLRRGRFTEGAIGRQQTSTSRRPSVQFKPEVEVRPFVAAAESYAHEGWSKWFQQ